MIHIDLEKATWLLDQCVKQRGEDYVYPSDHCRYVDGNSRTVWIDETQQCITIKTPDEAKPGCMIGLALIKAGVPMSTFLELQINDADSHQALDELSRKGYLTITSPAKDLFEIAQSHQDRQTPWGVALEKAKAGDCDSE